ncbi:prenyltransferase/squalene oxidase repeat-containing protein, partial [Spirochaetota bacterium]
PIKILYSRKIYSTMIKKYLTTNPIQWLLENNDPIIRYLTLRDIVQKDYDREYNIIFQSKQIQTLLKSGTSGIMGNKNNYDIYYKGSMWYFAESIEMGMDKRTEQVDKTAQYITETSQLESGGFTLNWKPKVEAACRTGDMVKYLILAGYNDDRVEKGIHWILEHQRHDGGWLHCPLGSTCDIIKLMLFNKSGSGLKRESNTCINSCFYATIACSMALVHYENKHDEALKKAANFFLKRSLYLNSKNEPIKPKRFWNSDFRLLGYPVLNQYDILYGMNFISEAGYFKDSRTVDAFNLIMSKQNPDGSWNLENAQTGMLYGNDRKAPIGIKNKWVTLSVMRMLKNTERT